MTARLGRLLGIIADRALEQLAPLDAHLRAYLTMQNVGDYREPDVDAHIDELRDACADDACADGDLEPWERELRDLWEAEHRAGTVTDLPDGMTVDDLINSHKLPADSDTAADSPPAATNAVGGRPAGAAAMQPVSGAGRASTNDVATVIAVVLRGQGINSAPIYADLAARELAQHFEFHHK